MNTDKLHPIFAEVLSSANAYAVRKDLLAAVHFRGYVYATDGRIAIRTPMEGHNPAVYPDFGPATRLEWPKEPGEELAFPPVGEQPTEPCAYCDDTGQATEDCPGCEGTGEVECCECGQDRDCPECDGNSRVAFDGPCEKCNGTREVPRRTEPAVLIHPDDQHGIAGEYLRMLQKYGATIHAQKDDKAPYYFTIPGGVEGHVMPKLRSNE